MKKNLLFLSALMFSFAIGHAQAYVNSTSYGKKKQDAFAIDYSYPEEVVSAAIAAKMAKDGKTMKEEKGIFNKDKGVKIYSNVSIDAIQSNTHDYFFKTEKKGGKSGGTTLYMLMQDGGSNIISSLDAATTSKAKDFLNGLMPFVEAANLEMQIKEQEDNVAKTEKKYKNLQDDKSDMEKKIKKLQDDIAKNIKDQESTKSEIESMRKKLDDLKGSRKAN